MSVLDDLKRCPTCRSADILDYTTSFSCVQCKTQFDRPWIASRDEPQESEEHETLGDSPDVQRLLAIIEPLCVQVVRDSRSFKAVSWREIQGVLGAVRLPRTLFVTRRPQRTTRRCSDGGEAGLLKGLQAARRHRQAVSAGRHPGRTVGQRPREVQARRRQRAGANPEAPEGMD